MTWEQYWFGDPWMARAYAQAYLLKRKAMNEQLWLQGIYNANAFKTVIGNAFGKRNDRYLDKPLDIFPKTEAEKNQEKRDMRKRFVEWLTSWGQANKKHGGAGQNGES